MNIFMVKDFFFWYGDVPTFFAVSEMKMPNEMAFNDYAAPCMLMHFGVKRDGRLYMKQWMLKNGCVYASET